MKYLTVATYDDSSATDIQICHNEQEMIKFVATAKKLQQYIIVFEYVGDIDLLFHDFMNQLTVKDTDNETNNIS